MTEATPVLAGLNILVTRPAEQAENLCGLIEAAGGRALRLPLLEIAPAENTTAAEWLNRPEGWDWLVFVSANAVRHALPLGGWAERRPMRARIAAVGEATALALAEAGLRVDLIPEPQFNSESLLAAPELAEVAGRQILVVRGEGGRELLAEALRGRGATLAYAEVYRRRRPDFDAAAWLELWTRGGIDVATVTSGEALGHLTDFLGEAAADLARRTPLVVIGARIAGLAHQRGWQRVAVAERAGDQGLVDAILALWRNGEIRREPSAAS